MKISTLLLCLFLCCGYSQAQTKVAKIKIQTTIYCDHCMQCGSCGDRLEKAIYKEKGIKRVDIDDKAGTVSIVYNNSKTSVDKLRQAIASVGFDADDVKGNPEAYALWDDCCKKQDALK